MSDIDYSVNLMDPSPFCVDTIYKDLVQNYYFYVLGVYRSISTKLIIKSNFVKYRYSINYRLSVKNLRNGDIIEVTDIVELAHVLLLGI